MGVDDLSMARRAAGPSDATLVQAADWYALLRGGQVDECERQRWLCWLQASADHQAAWREVEAISGSFASLQDMPNGKQAAEKIHDANLRFRQRRRLITGIAGLAVPGGGTWLAWRQALLPASLMAWAADHRTATGMQRQLVLGDGTRVWLNTASAVDVAYTDSLRRLMLLSGEVFVETAGDAARPFVVDTAQGRLRALGTRFDVHQQEGETLVAVYAGAVEIRTASTRATTVVSAGMQARFSRETIAVATPACMIREAWTRGVLVAQDITLREVVAELTRYRRGYIGLADSIADLRVYGSFPIQDTDRALAMLGAALPIQVRIRPWWVSIEPRS